MAKIEDSFCEHLVDLLSPLGEVTYRRMFGGVGFYVDRRFMAIVDDGVLYLKADEVNRPEFERLGMAPFRPYANKPATMPYHEVPADLLDDQEALLELARSSVEAAARAATRRPK